ncbi:MAG: plastocyanin/azurin family copper-binding protein [Gemmatimonadota bacterium]
MARKPRSRTSLVLFAMLALLSCGGSDNGTTEPDTTGDLRVTVNADGSGLAGVTVRFFAGGGSTATTTQATGSDGRTTFADVAAGSHDVEIEVPDGFVRAAGEDDRKSASVTAGSTANVSFALEEEISGDVVEVTLNDDLTFSPATVTISSGTTIRWVSQSDMTHTVTPEGHSEWSSASLTASGQTFTHTFDDTGTFDYFCEPHLAQGMTGTITVEVP